MPSLLRNTENIYKEKFPLIYPLKANKNFISVSLIQFPSVTGDGYFVNSGWVFLSGRIVNFCLNNSSYRGDSNEIKRKIQNHEMLKDQQEKI